MVAAESFVSASLVASEADEAERLDFLPADLLLVSDAASESCFLYSTILIALFSHTKP